MTHTVGNPVFLTRPGIRTQHKRTFLLVMISEFTYRRVPRLSRQFQSSNVDCGLHVGNPVSLTATGIRQRQLDFIARFGVRNNLQTFVRIFIFNSNGNGVILDSKLATLYLEN